MSLLYDLVIGLGLALLFLIQVESVGFFGLKLIKFVTGHLKQSNLISWPGSVYVQHIMLGAFFYTGVLFWVGISRVLYAPLVLVLTFGIWLSTFVVFKRWKEYSWTAFKTFVANYQYQIIGTSIFFILSFPFTFRPITAFDSLSYHFPIAQLFLQYGNIDFIGHTFSLQPVMTYFWGIWFQSLPLEISRISFGINFTYTIVVGISLFWASVFGSEYFKWSKVASLITPSLLGLNLAALYWYGSGYNDLIIMAYGLVTTLYIFWLVSKQKFAWIDFVMGFLWILALSTLKFHTTIYAAILTLYFLTNIWSKLENEKWKQFRNILVTGVVLSIIFYLPWLIRSYIFTGKMLYPIGAGIDNWYVEAGSNTAKNHWNQFILKRFIQESLPYLFTVYTPLFFAGVISIAYKDLRSKIKDLWAMLVVSFILVFMITVVIIDRYFLAIVAPIIFLGIVGVDHFNKSLKLFSQGLVWVVLIGFLGISFTVAYRDDPTRTTYLTRYRYRETYLTDTVGKWIYTYYPGRYSPKPEDLSKEEKIFVFGVNNTGYIENPILDTRVETERFEGLNSAKDLYDILKKDQIRYILLKRTDIQFLCKQINMKNFETCYEDNQYWSGRQFIDQDQESHWLKVKY